MASSLLDVCRFNPTLGGTTDWTYSSAVTGYQSPTAAGVVNSSVYSYRAESADLTQWEVGTGAYNTGTGVQARTTVLYNSAGTTAKINFSVAPQVAIVALLEDFTTSAGSGWALPNCTLAASVSSNILTVSLKDNAGNDPSATSPVFLSYRSATAATGSVSVVPQTAALSITTNATGATLGTVSTVPFRLWVVVFNNAGANVLALWQSVTGGSTPTAVAALNEAAVASSTAISGTATAAGTFYTPNGTTVTSKAFRILGYIDFASGLTTAGTYASGPTTIQTFGPGIKKPGDIVQSVVGSTTSATTTTSSTPQTTGCSLSISPTSAPNLVKVLVTGPLSPQVNGHFGFIQIFRGSTAVGIIGKSYGGGGAQISQAAIQALDAPGTTSSTTYAVKLNNDDNVSSCIFPYVAVNGSGAWIFADEVMV